MTTSELARRAGVNVQTVRFYERKGLLPAPPRTPGGYRRYDADALRRLRFIKHAQEIGFSLREIDELLSLRIDAGRACADVRRHAHDKIAEVDRRLRKLEQMRQVLARLVERCDRDPAPSDCPILEALDEETFGVEDA